MPEVKRQKPSSREPCRRKFLQSADISGRIQNPSTPSGATPQPPRALDVTELSLIRSCRVAIGLAIRLAAAFGFLCQYDWNFILLLANVFSFRIFCASLPYID